MEIKNYWLVFDAFGKLPVWSIQHFKKEADDSYLLYPNEKQYIKTSWFKEIERLERALDKVSAYYVAISGKMNFKYSKILKDRIVTHLKIDRIVLFPDEGNPLGG